MPARGACPPGWPSRARELESIFDIDGRARISAEGAVREIEC